MRPKRLHVFTVTVLSAIIFVCAALQGTSAHFVQAVTTIVVTNTNDSGAGSLRQAILDANANAGTQTITFNIPGTGTQTITPQSALPDITGTVTIDGYTQPGSSVNTLIVGNNAVLLIEINGASQNTDLFHFFANNNVIRGLVVNQAPFDGIFLGSPNGIPTTGNVVEGNFIGTDPTGTIARGNGRFGVSLYFYPSANNLIGGATPSSRNLISGNGQGGVVIGSVGSANNVVSGNYIGTTASGIAGLQNNIRGIFVGAGASGNMIGGATTGERNVVSGNSGSGVELFGSGLTNNDVRGNYIGVAADGAAALGNFGYGVNVGETATGNTILSNLIFANQANGINLGANDVTPNDVGDADTGANNLQNFPVITSAVRNGGNTTLQGTLNSTPNTNGFVVEFFVNATCDSSGYGEGQRFLGSTTINTDNSGNAAFNQTFAATINSGEAATATATDPDGNTSEFSQCATVLGTPQTFTVTNTADTGAGSLRQAITDANANNLATDTIAFNIPGTGVQSIAPLSPLPDITDPVIIDGYTQPGSSANTNSMTTGSNAVLLIELNGTNAGTGAGKDGLRLFNGGSIVRGLAINRFGGEGINFVDNSDNNIIQGNFIGTDATGTMDFGNASAGIASEVSDIRLTPASNLIGGMTPAARNIISGNGGNGIEFIFSADNVIRGNFIGLAADGATAIGNTGAGVVAGSFTSGTIIGGDDTTDGATDGIIAARNYISGNGGNGIFTGGAAFGGTMIMGNYIGTDTTGTLARANNGGIGTNIASNSIIGGTTAGAGNLISGNINDGINIGNTGNLIVRGNRIGTAADGVSPLGNTGDGVEIFAGGSNNRIGGIGAGEGNIIAFNTLNGVQITDVGITPTGNPILSNAIYSNGGLGINLSQDAVTPNDAGDPDSGANNRQNFPVLTFVSNSSTTTINGALDSPSGDYRIEFFSNASCDSSGNGEGRTFLGFTTTTGANSAFTFSATLPANQQVITATATNNTIGDTSEFSSCFSADTVPPVVTSIEDNDDDDTVIVNETLTYTVTFNEDIDAAALTAEDFDNAGTSAITIGTITETSPGVFSVQVTPTTTGTIILRVGTNVSDTAGNNLDASVSDDTTVTVNAAPLVCTPPPTGMVAWLAGDGDTTDLIGSNNGVAVGRLDFATGKVLHALHFGEEILAEVQGVQEPNGYVAIEDDDSLDLTRDMSVDAWINPQPDPEASPTPFTRTIVSKRSGDNENVSYELFLRGGRLGFATRNSEAETTDELLTESTIPTNTFTHVAATIREGEGVQLLLYINGVESAADNDFAFLRPDTTGRLTIGAAELSDGQTTSAMTPFIGEVDEVELFDRALGEDEIRAIVAADTAGKCKPPRVTPGDDAHVRGATPDTNYGSSPELQVKRTLNPGNGKGRQAYLRFDTSNVEGTIERAILRVYGGLNAVTPENVNLPVAVFPVSDQEWTESTITWNNKPRPNVPMEIARAMIRNYRRVTDEEGTPGDMNTVPDATPQWYDFDITDYVNQEREAGRRVGVILRNMERGGIGDFYTRFNSKESEANRPRLVLTVAPPVPSSVSKPR